MVYLKLNKKLLILFRILYTFWIQKGKSFINFLKTFKFIILLNILKKMKFLWWVFIILKRFSILSLSLKIKRNIPIDHSSFNFLWWRYCKYCNFASRWATILFFAIFRRIRIVARFKPYDPAHTIYTFKNTSLNIMIIIIKPEYETILLVIKKII